MPSTPEYALMAANAYAVKSNVTSIQNEISLPIAWRSLNIDAINDSTGFTARAYKSNAANEIVIAYTGTTKEPDGASDWTNGNIPGATGWSLAKQLLDAAKFYLDVRKANQGAEIRLTGHSLGGGLASLISVFFDKEAKVFDEAPFGKSATADFAAELKTQLAQAGYTSSAGFDLSGLESYQAGQRLGRVESIYAKGEILTELPNITAGTAVGLSVSKKGQKRILL